MKKSLMILGGTGFFGKVFLDAYLKNSLNNQNINSLILVGNNFKEVKKIISDSKKKKKILNIKLNLRKAKKLPYADYIIYAAEYVSYNKILNNHKNNKAIQTLDNCFKILSNNVFLKSKILYVSSGAVYKKHDFFKRRKFTEKSEIYSLKSIKHKTIKEMYLANKLTGEKKISELCKMYSRKTSIVRCFALIGKYIPLTKHYIIGNLLNSVIKKKMIKIYEKSSKFVFRSYMHTDDLVKCLMNVLISSNKKCPIYNVGSENPISIWQLGNYFSKKFNIKVIYAKQNMRKFDFYIPCVKKIKKKFNLDLDMNVHHLIDRTIKDIRS
jgi:dTDP-glucose 4,6-dehydratase